MKENIFGWEVYKTELKLLQKRIDVATGRIPADIVIRNGVIIDVFNGSFIEEDVAIVDGVFAGVGQYEGKEIIDAKGRYICPAFIDGHVHIESSMVPPREFAKVLLTHGVTSVVADPHEIANVAGVQGIECMLRDSENIPFDAYFMLPSSVPSTLFESSGSRIEAEDLMKFYSNPRILGLGEVMDYSSIFAGKEPILKKILLTKYMCRRIDGHSAGLNQRGINVYTASGIHTDHEATNAEEGIVRLQRGMNLMIREGTAAKNLKDLIPIINKYNSRRCLLVTDDKHLDDLMENGSVDHSVRIAISKGISPIMAIQMATLNAAECFNIFYKGAIAPGYEADFILLDDVDTIKISEVYKNGVLVSKEGVIKEELFDKYNFKEYTNILNSVHIKALGIEDFKLPLPSGKAHIIKIIPNNLYTEDLVEEVKVKNGYFEPSIERDQLKLAVIERHKGTVSMAVAIVKGIQLKEGAIASTVAHDSHNIVIAGTNDEDMLFAANTLAKMKGGLVVVNKGKVLAALPLPIAGLMSNKPCSEVVKTLKKLQEAALFLGASKEFDIFLTLSFLALPVIPELKLTDRGLFHIGKGEIIPVEVK